MIPPHALKEWSVVCDLLASGHTALLPRKGGVREWGGAGVFELEHRRFWLFPTREHERRDRIKPAYLAAAPGGVDASDDVVRLAAYAEAAHIAAVPSREAFDRLDDLHPWLPPAIDMRFDYKPENPLYLVVLRVYRVAEPLTVPHRQAYRGCRSWVPLEARDMPDVAGAVPAMSDEAFASVLSRVREALR